MFGVSISPPSQPVSENPMSSAGPRAMLGWRVLMRRPADVRGLIGAAVAADVGEPHVVREDEDDVGTFGAHAVTVSTAGVPVEVSWARRSRRKVSGRNASDSSVIAAIATT